METVTLATILADIGQIVTSAVGWLGSIVNAVVGSPLLLMAALLAFVGIGIHWFRMLSR